MTFAKETPQGASQATRGQEKSQRHQHTKTIGFIEQNSRALKSIKKALVLKTFRSHDLYIGLPETQQAEKSEKPLVLDAFFQNRALTAARAPKKSSKNHLQAHPKPPESQLCVLQVF